MELEEMEQHAAAASVGEQSAPTAGRSDVAIESLLVDQAMRGLRFREVQRIRWRQRRRINLQELRIVRHTLAHAARTHGIGNRIVIGVDSLVACGVINRGRSASAALN
eukprot:6906701-Alexandrium_andersonii.AAC.1